MKFGVKFIQGTEDVAHYYLHFDSGKKLVLSKEEGEEIEDRLKLAKAEGKFAATQHRSDVAQATKQLLDWLHKKAAQKGLEQLEETLGEICPIEDAIVSVAALEEKDATTVRAESISRGLKVRARKRNSL